MARESMDPQRIRNFAIIAHIDHGKSTLADRLLELTGSVAERDMHAQGLDPMGLEREGGLLVVDASQGVEAQTLANSYLAINHGLDLIPVINKIDLPSAEVPRVKEMIEQAIGLDTKDALLVSAKTGQ